MQPLPIDALLPEIVASLRRTPNLVIEAPPGAGKTTRVPPALLDVVGGREVWVLEPRRLAAHLSARRVAEERNEKIGETVGYQVRFEEAAGPRTKLRYLTEGIFTRRFLSDPQLARVGAVVLDEFHERHLPTDLALALLKQLQNTARPELRIIVMSATLEAAPVAAFLDDCPVIRSEGRRYGVAVEHLARPDERPLLAQIESSVRRLVAEDLSGDVLVFLPGAAEIRRAADACSAVAAEANLLVLPLHGDLSAHEQDRAIRPAERRKVILSTNVAETSITIDGVSVVIDSGFARIAGHSPWSGLPKLIVARISQASAAQRAGRAGRTRHGRCLRLYTAQDFAARPAHDAPEVMRLDLAESALELHAMGVVNLAEFAWFERPAEAALAAAETLLARLGAINREQALTDLGRRMLRLPLHPRLARLVIEAEARGVARAGCIAAALLNERDIRASHVMLGARARGLAVTAEDGPSDVLELVDLFSEAERARFSPERLRQLNLDAVAVRTVDRARRQLEQLCEVEPMRKNERRESSLAADTMEREKQLLISVLAGYPDRVARRRAGAELLLAGGGSAQLAPESVVRQAEFLVAIDAEERPEPGIGKGARPSAKSVVRLASAIEIDWLLDLFPDEIRESNEAHWSVQAERVEASSRLTYGQLILAESRIKRANEEEAARILAGAALAAGVSAFADPAEINQLLARVEFMRSTFPEAAFQTWSEDDVTESLRLLCEGRQSFAELREAIRGGEFKDLLLRVLSAEQGRLLKTMAPERVRLGGHRQVRVQYERDQPPWIASRLQDFFGMREGPRIAKGRAPLVLHLLAPNGRAVQVTSDLAGFWQRHYPQVRRELGRRYPRHAWPEDPLRQSGDANRNIH